MKFTYFGSNTWLIELAGQTILVDPWLRGNLSFGGQDWFFQGKLQKTLPIPPRIDLILLSQGLADHAHEPTLKVLDPQTPVVGSPTAAKVAERLGYSQVTALKPGDRLTWGTGAGAIEIEAVPGAPVPQVENGYILSSVASAQRIYYEPHAFFDPQISRFAPVDVLISPVVNLELPLLGPLIQGYTAAPELVKLLQPKHILPTATGGEVEFTGILMNLLKAQGTIAEFEAKLKTQGSSAIVKSLQPNETLELVA
ncbi:MAG: MBL fold metallo-hydrolase [Prochlorotrichaceae cyanobacterium]|jgi:L-ascorbate metabolism protein UlaG (beta-lactamase superfamily)